MHPLLLILEIAADAIVTSSPENSVDFIVANKIRNAIDEIQIIHIEFTQSCRSFNLPDFKSITYENIDDETVTSKKSSYTFGNINHPNSNESTDPENHRYCLTYYDYINSYMRIIEKHACIRKRASDTRRDKVLEKQKSLKELIDLIQDLNVEKS